jgi:uncharacterized protein (DUF2132 family)
MDTEINYKSNPLHGVSLKTMLCELVDHYGFDILYAYLSINCFKTNASIASSVKWKGFTCINLSACPEPRLNNFYYRRVTE